MDPRTAFINYVEDLAKRNADIAHTTAAPRFFLELVYNKLQGPKEKPDNKDWNLVLMGFETRTNDNGHGRAIEKVVMIFDILKHVSKGNTAEDLTAIYSTAREIGEEFLCRFEEHTKKPCDAEVSAGITVPYSLVLGSKMTIEVGPRFDAMYGYRFSIDVLLDEHVKLKKASDPAKWITPA